MTASRVLIVSPVRDEAAHIELAIRSVVAQTRPPDAWLVVDDGSEDVTLEILRRFESEVPLMTVLSAPRDHTPDDGDRLAVAAEARAFNWALRGVDRREFTHIGKLDGDIELDPDCFERLLAEFERDPCLGIAGGTLLERSRGEWRPMRVPRHHVRGGLRLYSRECFEAIGGIEERLGWDGMDLTHARLRGFVTRSFPDIRARHHRPVGSSGGLLRSRARAGEADYVLRFHLLWALLKSFKVAASRPFGLSGAAFLYGYLRAAARSTPRVAGHDYERFMRSELRRRALSAPSRLLGRS